MILAAISVGLAHSRRPRRPRPAPATLAVTGDVATPLTLKADDLAKMPRETASVTDQDGTKVEYEGVPLREILKRAGAPLGNQLRGKALASYVLAKAHDGYQVCSRWASWTPRSATNRSWSRTSATAKPLFGYQGPFRLVCPNDKAGARSVRMLETLEVVRLQK